MNIGTLTIEMAANIGRLQADMNQAKSLVNSSMKDIQQAVDAAKSAFIALTGVAGVSAFQDMILSSIEAVAKLRALSVQSGMTVESLSGLAAVGRATGTGADTIAAATNKFSKALATANEDSKGAATALKALGLSFDDFQRMSPDERMKKVADAMALFQDGGQKSAAAMLLFGKAGAEMLPFLKDLANTGELQAKITKEQAEQAHQFEVQIGKLKVQSDAWKKSLALELLPTLNDIAEAMLALKSSTGEAGTILGEGLTTVLQTVAVLGVNIVYVFKQVGITIGGIAAQFAALFSGDFKSFGTINELMAADAAKARIEVDKLSSSLLGLTNSKAGAGRGGNSRTDPRSLGVGEDFKAQITGLNGDASGGLQADATKKILEGQLKAQDDFIAAEKTQLQTRQQYLDFYKGLEYFTLRQTEEKKQSLIADNLQNTLKAYDKELAALAIYMAQAAEITDPEDARNKMAEVNKKRAAAEVEANKQIGDSLNTLLAIQRQFDLGTIERGRQDDIANKSAQFQIDMLGRETLEVLKATEARRIQLQLDERIYALKKLDPNADTTGAAAQAATQTAIATAKIEESYKKQRDAAYGANEAVRKYVEDIGNQAKQMESMFAKAFKGMEDALVNFVKTGKLDFKSLADGIITDLIRIQVQNSITKPLASAMGGGGSGLSGLFNSAKSLFGFADGGIMTSMGSMPLNRYEGGGIASSPQLAMFGEGSKPEAYVPLPDGRSIPVTMQGGGGGGVVVNQNFEINATNASAETVGQIRALMPSLLAENKRAVEGIMQQATARRGGRVTA